MRRYRSTDVFLDVCTQRDFLCDDGAAPCRNASAVRENVRRLMAVARLTRPSVVSCVESRRPCEVRGVARPSCVVGTAGHAKLAATLLPRRVQVDSDNFLCVALDLLDQYQQAVFVTQHRDPFTNPKLDRVLTELPAERFVLFGAGLECALRMLALGLMLRGRRVVLAEDASGFWECEAAEMTRRQLAAKGCAVVSTNEIVDAHAQQLSRRIGATRSVA